MQKVNYQIVHKEKITIIKQNKAFQVILENNNFNNNQASIPN